ncbi:PREDICTED: F-box protein PP2-B5 [Camelina sativa]|uniref:F-box protein PP2-B5 n=1 Tax=Camelina sativa TaxID=90675 RepID=A0ABM0YK58_CAMSA|nr:PREDICTED: F-box protein PP2-B5 [Camelina sativa]
MGQKHGVDARGKGGKFCGCWEIITEFINGSSPSFDDLPDDCLSIISSFTTTPRDAFLAALVSKSFRLQFDSDSVWEKFLPSPDYVSQIPKSRVFSSKKELYFALCDPFPNHNGRMSFRLDKASGKKCVMLSARKLLIRGATNPRYWKWISIPESRFEKVPELLDIDTFNIRGALNTRNISPGTHYSTYIVYTKTSHCYGFQNCPIQVGVGFHGYVMPKTSIYLDTVKKWPGRNIEYSKKRKDGWMEVKIGDFFNEEGFMGFDDLIEVSVLDVTRRLSTKRGVIIEGIEFRPKDTSQ